MTAGGGTDHVGFVRPTASSAATLVIVALPSFLLGAFAPEIKVDLGIGDAALGALFTSGYAVSATVMHLTSGLADRHGARWALRLGLVVAAVGSLMMATVADTVLIVALAFAVNRTAEAICQPASNALVARSVPSDRRGASMGIKQASIPTATLLAGLAVPLLGDRIGWEGTFALVAAAAVPVWLALPPVGGAADPAPRGESSMWGLPHLRLIGIAGAFSAAAVVSVAGFLVVAARDAGFSDGTASLLLTLGGAVMVTARVSFGLAADRIPFNRFRVVAVAVSVGSVAYLLFATGAKPAMVAGTVLVFSVGWSWPGLLLLGVIELHPDEPGAATAVLQTGVRVGALVAPVVFGVVADNLGFPAAWTLAFASAATTGLLMFRAAHAVDDHRATVAP